MPTRLSHRRLAPRSRSADSAGASDLATPRTLLTVKQFAERHVAFSEASLRKLIFNAGARFCIVNGLATEVPGNGLGVALVHIGRRVLIDEHEFFAWVARQSLPQYQGSRRK